MPGPQDLPLAKKMGAAPSVLVPEGSSQGMPGQVPSPTMKAPEDEAGEGRSAPSAEAGRLRGFIQPASGNEQESSELETLIKRDDRHSSLEDCAWVSVPKPGGGVRYYNYVSQKHREAHDGKLSRDLHYKPEARLRVAEDAIVSLVGEVHELSGKAEAASTQVALLRDELKASTRERWYSNHRSRWHNDPATTLHVDWSQLAGLVAKSCTDAANECIAGSRISGMADAARMCQQVCGRIHHGLSVAAYVSCTGILQTAQLTYEAEASSGPSRLLGRVLPASKCKITYLAMSSGETVHVADVKSDDRIFFWRGYATGGGSFAAIPIFAPGSGQCVGVLSVDTMHRPPVKQLSTVELEAMEVIANGLGGILEAAMEAERASCSRSIAATAEAARSTRVGAVGMAGPGPAEARAAQNIALSCGMQAAENALRGPRGSGDQLEAAILELEGLESPSRAIVAVCSALLTVIDYDVIISEMEARQWAVPVDRDEQMSLWHSVILSGMDEIATNMRMVFDHLAPADVSVPNCLRFERAEALLAAITLDDITAKGTPMVVQLIYQWLIAAQEVNNLAVVGREAEVAAQQLGEQAAKFRPGQVTADVLCDIICKRLG